MKGPASLVTLSDELFVAFPTFNGRENRYLESWEFFMGVAVPAVVAAQTNAFQIRNPAGSNVIAVIESLKANALAALTLQLNWSNTNTTDLGTASSVHSVDSRGRAVSTCIASTAAGSPTAFTTTLQTYTFNPVNASGLPGDLELITFDDQEIVITPGVTLQFLDQTANTGWHMNIIFRERFLEESERT